MKRSAKRRYLAIPPRIGRSTRTAQVHLMQRSPYYWWWAYLKRNADYLACCESGGHGPLAELYRDFGDVRSDDFRAWWGGAEQRGPTLFQEQYVASRVTRLERKEDWRGDWDQSVVMVVSVDLRGSRAQLIEDFSKLVAATTLRRQGRPNIAAAQSTAKYPLCRNTDQHNLRTMLEAYDAWVLNQALSPSDRKPMWAVAEQLKLVPTARPTRQEFPAERAARHNVLTNAMSRYVNRARRIIANTSKGQFPLG